MILGNLGLVGHVLRHLPQDFKETAWDRDDAVAAGVVGLIQAVDNFDPHRGVRFSNFALVRIRGSILDFRRQMDILSRSARRRRAEAERKRMDMAAVLGRWPTLAEVSLQLQREVDPSELDSRAVLVSLDKLTEPNQAALSRPFEPM